MSSIIEQQALTEFTEKAYLNYSMYVILDRALPFIGDGLKPVQRRIVYAMSELGLSHSAKYKKSARTVGDVLGKFHPHGDSACYEAMVLMAQPFSYRHTLIDGQGNWGSIDDPKSFAAMRYTESRLTSYAQSLLAELAQGTVQWQANFDGSLDEPVNLPARLPNILLNGASGIAVGMATDIPSHNLREVVQACVHLLQHPKASTEDLCEFIQGPDFATCAEIITPREQIIQMYQTGTGSIRQRAVYHLEDNEIVISALPYQTSVSKTLEQIAQQMQAKKLPMVSDLRDESDQENPMRLVIVPRSNRVDHYTLMQHLFASTDLEKSYRVNMNMINLEGKPQVMDLRTCLQQWLIFRTETVKKRLHFRLDKVNKRLHVLDGLLAAYLNLDEVIRIIRYEENPKQELMVSFSLTQIQAEAILDLKLRHLAKLEEMKIRGEQSELNEERTTLEQLLSSEARLKTLIKKELLSDAEKYGDDRRASIVQREAAKALEQSDLMPSEAITAVLSQQGWIRAAKGHDIDPKELNYKAGDAYQSSARGKTNQSVTVLDNAGRSYTIAAHALPSARGQGEPLTSQLSPATGVGFCKIIINHPDTHYVLASSAGYGFVCQLANMHSKNKKGKATLKVGKNDNVLLSNPVDSPENAYIAVVTNAGYLSCYNIEELPQLAKGKGVKLINIPKAKTTSQQEHVVSIVIFLTEQSIRVNAGKRHLRLKPQDIAHYTSSRGKRGKKLPQGFQNVDSLSIDT